MPSSEQWKDVATFTVNQKGIRDAPPFAGAKAKVERAKKHLSDLIEIHNAHLESAWYKYSVTSEGDSHPKTHTIDITPPGFLYSATLGDVVHNLRASLDHVAVAAVELNEKNPKDVYFPFAPSIERLEDSIKKAKFSRASPDAVDLLRSFKPYRGGNAALRGLHDLDVSDKHRSLVPAMASIKITGEIDPILDHHVKSVHVEEPRLVFEESGPLGKEEILPTLEGLFDLVESIVFAFEALLVCGGSR